MVLDYVKETPTMDIEQSLRRLIHREMRAHINWHRIDKLESEGNGYSIVISLQSNPREYSAAVDLMTALKRYFRNVQMQRALSYTTNQHNVYSICLSCHSPKVLSLHQGNSSRAA